MNFQFHSSIENLCLGACLMAWHDLFLLKRINYDSSPQLIFRHGIIYSYSSGRSTKSLIFLLYYSDMMK